MKSTTLCESTPSAMAYWSRRTTMDDTLKQLGALVTRVSVTYSRKVSTGDYGSEGAVFGVEADTPAGADIDAVGDALYAWAKTVATRNLAPDLKARTSFGPVSEEMLEDTVVPPGAVVPPAKPEPTRTKIDDDGAEYEYVKVSGLTVQFTPTGKKVGKIKGGKYTKIGVTVWPEILKAVGLDIEPLSAGEYQPPELTGKTAVCLMKVSDKSGKPYPEKVVEFVE